MTENMRNKRSLMSLGSVNNIVKEGLEVWWPAKPLMSRLPEPSHVRGKQSILRVSSAARNSVEGLRNAISAI